MAYFILKLVPGSLEQKLNAMQCIGSGNRSLMTIPIPILKNISCYLMTSWLGMPQDMNSMESFEEKYHMTSKNQTAKRKTSPNLISADQLNITSKHHFCVWSAEPDFLVCLFVIAMVLWQSVTKQGPTRHRLMAHPVVFGYLSYSTTLAEHAVHRLRRCTAFGWAGTCLFSSVQ